MGLMAPRRERQTVTRMKTARIVVLTIALGAGGIAEVDFQARAVRRRRRLRTRRHGLGLREHVLVEVPVPDYPGLDAADDLREVRHGEDDGRLSLCGSRAVGREQNARLALATEYGEWPVFRSQIVSASNSARAVMPAGIQPRLTQTTGPATQSPAPARK